MPAAKDTKKAPEEAKQSGSKLKNFAVLGVLVAGVAFFVTVLGDKQKVKANLEAAVHFIESQGDNALYVYLAFTLIGVVCLVPTTPIEFAGGFLFSPKYGMLMTLFYTSFAKLIANCISVLMARYIFRDWVMENFVSRFELLQLVSTAVKEEPWKMAFLVRGSMVPLAVKNYGLGVMDMSLLPIGACSCIFTTFYAFQNIYLGSACQDLNEVFGGKTASANPGDWTETVKKCLPIGFNVLLVIFLVKAVKAQINKAKTQISAQLAEKKES